MMLRGFTLKPRGSFSLFALPTQPPLRFGDDAEDLLSNRRMIKKPRFLMRGDIPATLLPGTSISDRNKGQRTQPSIGN
jgi:hypothetical protein